MWEAATVKDIICCILSNRNKDGGSDKCLCRASSLPKAECPTAVNLGGEAVAPLHCFLKRNKKNWSGAFERQDSG